MKIVRTCKGVFSHDVVLYVSVQQRAGILFVVISLELRPGGCWSTLSTP